MNEGMNVFLSLSLEIQRVEEDEEEDEEAVVLVLGFVCCKKMGSHVLVVLERREWKRHGAIINGFLWLL